VGAGMVKAKVFYWLGNSSDPKSKHFNDQSEMYQRAIQRRLLLHERCRKTERTKYHPGE
jgi:hypothetical protein